MREITEMARQMRAEIAQGQAGRTEREIDAGVIVELLRYDTEFNLRLLREGDHVAPSDVRVFSQAFDVPEETQPTQRWTTRTKWRTGRLTRYGETLLAWREL